MTTALVDVNTLASWMDADEPLVVLDCRARLMDASAGRAMWQEGHIPGAIHADMAKDLASPANHENGGGRHPLPKKDTFAEQLRQWGISPQTRVVVYDDAGGQLAAARAWWLLLWAGQGNVHVLDGGWQAWQEEDGRVEQGETLPQITPSNWQPSFNDNMIATADDVARGDALLLDGRAGERYRGENEPIDPVAGHIPGAVNLPSSDTLDASTHHLLAAEELDSMMPQSDETIAYCGSGVSACQLILAHAVAGRELPRLYPGSWSEWSRDPDRPVETNETAN
ncbi:sulfurtransferase [Phytohalomonas tamaricis]|uniref:sulfurtransferase n=1 Tax=Phytohalomonas tamaricis TaxID=2081032 RepID=UPI000D0AF0D4|nr:sulfurtransferase [Phytohalomonas tamaricis]